MCLAYRIKNSIEKQSICLLELLYFKDSNYHGEVEANLRAELVDSLDFCVVVDAIENFLPNMQVKRVFRGAVQQVC